MGKVRAISTTDDERLGRSCTAADAAAATACSPLLLPPPPPLQPRPDILNVATDAALVAEEAATAATEPLDYSMKRLLADRSPSPSLSTCSTSPLSRDSPGLLLHQQLPPPPQPPRAPPRTATLCSGDDVLHRLRHTVLQRHPQRDSVVGGGGGGGVSPTTAVAAAAALANAFLSVANSSSSSGSSSGSIGSCYTAVAAKLPPPQSALQQQQQQPQDPELDAKVAYAAECIKSRLEGCGKRVHLFLGILLHFGMPPNADGEQIFDRVIAFSDGRKNLCDHPTAYFMVLDSKLLALVWSKFKGNSSNEYSTLTRAIRSTRQKYKGIFEAVENPGKRLYKFGPVALDQFRQLFPASYGGSAKLQVA